MTNSNSLLIQTAEQELGAPFNYDLPQEKIAQRPVYPPESAKLLVCNKSNPEKIVLTDSTFTEIPSYLNPMDLLVINNTKVIPARLFGKVASSNVEVLLLKRIKADQWIALGKPGKKLQPKKVINFSKEDSSASVNLTATIIDRDQDNTFRIVFKSENYSTDQAIEKIGNMPIPPYIRKGHSDEKDKEDYQTIFAKINGSIAAPTASLHFSPKLIDEIKQKGIKVAFLTLHVGSASFLPIYRDGKLVPPGTESYECSQETYELIKRTKEEGGRVIAVGTTVTRALESIAQSNSLKGDTTLFITPEYKFKFVDSLITNFHQPGTTHLYIVEAMLGREGVDQVYQHALKSEYRFLSYGDGMMI